MTSPSFASTIFTRAQIFHLRLINLKPRYLTYIRFLPPHAHRTAHPRIPQSTAATQHREGLSDRQLPHCVMPNVHHETQRSDIHRDAAHSCIPMFPSTPDNKRDTHTDTDTEATASPRHPSTPEIALLPPLLVADISPTDSNFSTALEPIFDSPSLHGRQAPTPPNTAWCASTSNSSVCGQHSAFDRSSTWAQHSETDTLCESDAHLEDGDVPPLDTAAPHLISLTSCLQCVLADLPCSRTLPSCTRCVRNGEVVCVAQRNRVLQEMRRDGYKDDPILVVEVGEGEEVVRKEEEMTEVSTSAFLVLVV